MIDNEKYLEAIELIESAERLVAEGNLATAMENISSAKDRLQQIERQQEGDDL